MSQPYPPPPALPPYSSGPVNPPGEVPLHLPHYGISFGAAIRRFFAKYATFSGRASRSEYWWVMLALTLFYIGWVVLLLTAQGLTGGFTDEDELTDAFWAVLVLGLVAALALVVPSIAVQVRRLHDANLSGWFWLMNLIPYAGGIIMLVFMLLASKPEGARFDEGFTPMGYGSFPPPAGFGQPGQPPPHGQPTYPTQYPPPPPPPA